jgi:hypothetical protein
MTIPTVTWGLKFMHKARMFYEFLDPNKCQSLTTLKNLQDIRACGWIKRRNVQLIEDFLNKQCCVLRIFIVVFVYTKTNEINHNGSVNTVR